MGKKKSGNKKKDDYWDEAFNEDAVELGSAVASEEGSASMTVSANQSDDDDGGLMAQISQASKKKTKKKKQLQQYAVSDEEEPESAEIPAPAEAPAAEQQVEKPPKAAPARAPVDEDNPGRILTKKEKERIKKEKLKEQKRLEAEKKKALGNADKKTEPKSNVPAPAPTANESEEVSKNVEETVAPASGKPKKVPKALLALQKRQEALRAAEEEAKRLAEEEKKRIEEEERKAAEEEAEREEKQRIKKEKREAEREQLRKEGKLLTKAQKEAQKKIELRRAQLLESGAISVEALKAASEDSKKPGKRIVYDNKRKNKAQLEKKKQEEEEKRRREEEEHLKKEEEAKAKAKAKAKAAAEESSDEDDWEKAALSSDDEKKEDTKEDDESLKDAWDDESEEEKEETKPATTTPSPTKTIPAVKSQPVKAASTKTAPTKAAASPAASSASKASPPTSAKKQPVENSDESSEEDDSSDDDSDESSSDEELTAAEKLALQKKEEAAARRLQRQKDAMAARSADDLRSPICCILGHVDTGKTKLLDKIRQTNVQEGEAGGITQQIGATYFPAEAIEQKTAVLGEKRVEKLKLPGLLIIDTPGHESFTNLRTRGSSLCNIAILVVDIMHGLEPQTIESIRLLRDRKTPFIVALNKIDRLFEWEETPNNSFEDSLAKQKQSVRDEFEDRVAKTMLAFAEQGLNSQLYYKNKNFAKYVSLVPTSAHTGEGIPDMLNLLVNLTQSRMSDKLMYVTELECTVLEVKVVEGLGTTIDVVLVNGWLHEGDKIVVCGLNGAIVTQVRALLTPQPMRELRIKSQYVHHKSVKAALGIKISAPDLENAIAGSRLLVCGPDDDEEDLKEEVMSDLTNLTQTVNRTGHGVWVQASTLGALEALLEFLRTSKIPVAGINIGPVHKKDVTKASVMLDRAPEYAVMLCFDVKIDKDAEAKAAEMGIKLFTADIIYHLFDRFEEHMKGVEDAKREEQKDEAIFPCILKMVPGAVFRKKNPIIIGVDVIEGVLKIGTPICVVKTNPETKAREHIRLGKVTSIESNHKTVLEVKKGKAGGGVAIKIESAAYEVKRSFGDHFEEKDELYSHISRQSIDILKTSFLKDVSKEDWRVVVKLKGILNIK